MSGSAAPPNLTVSSNGIGAVPDTLLNTFMQSSALLADMRNFVGLSNMTVEMIGTTVPGDGGQGVFYYNPSATTADDGGVTSIAPNGIVVGRWLRLSGGTSAVTVVPNIASLRALTTGVSPVLVEGYHAPGDGGGGFYLIGTTAADNGGTIILSANGTYYLDTFGQPVSIRQFGCKGDGTTDDTAGIQAAVTAIGGSSASILIPTGQFAVSATITGTQPITVCGVGSGFSPGSPTGFACSVILCLAGFTTGDVFAITTLYPCVFRDFQIAASINLSYTSVCPRSSGAGIHIAGTAGHVNLNSVIGNVCFSGMFVGVHLERCQEGTLVEQTSHQAWGYCGVYAENGDNATESSHGQILNNYFFGNTSGAQTAGVVAKCGYGSIRGNKFLGAQYGVQILAVQNVNIGSVMIAFNSFEENTVQSVYVTTDSPIISSIQIVSNQFSCFAPPALSGHIVVQPSVGGAESEIVDVDISGNNFYSQTTAASAAFIVFSGANATIARNKGRVVGGAAYGVIAETGTDQNTQVLDNEWSANGGSLLGTTGYLLQGNVVLRDLSSRLFTVALLPNATNGSMIYVTDGHATNTATFNLTVTSGGPGCVAQMMNGAWLTIQP